MPSILNQSSYSLQQETDNPKRQETDMDIWGLNGVWGVVKDDDPEKSRLAVGVDVNSLGLNMNQPEYILYHKERWSF